MDRAADIQPKTRFAAGQPERRITDHNATLIADTVEIRPGDAFGDDVITLGVAFYALQSAASEGILRAFQTRFTAKAGRALIEPKAPSKLQADTQFRSSKSGDR